MKEYYKNAIDLMEKQIHQTMTNMNISASTVVIMDHEEVIYKRHFGWKDKEKNIPLTDNTLYNIGSISKLYTTVSILKLAQNNRLSLEDKIIKYIPEFTMDDSRYGAITIKMLLNHTSGLPGGNYKNWFLYGIDTNNKLVETLFQDLRNQSLKANPGDYSVYCNEAFILAQIIIERVSCMSFEDFLKQQLFDPMGIKYTYATSNVKITDDMFARQYDITGKLIPREIVTRAVTGAGGLASNALDLAKFGYNILNTDSKILNLNSINIFSQPQNETLLQKNSPVNGLGWDYVKYKYHNLDVFTKGGGTTQYLCQLIVAPKEGITIVGLSTSPSNMPVIMEKLIYNMLIDSKSIVIPIDKTKELRPCICDSGSKMLKYQGKYCIFGAPLILDVKITKNKFHMNMNPLSVVNNVDCSIPYVYCSDGKFWTEKSIDNKYEGFSFKEINGYTYLMQHMITYGYEYEIAYAQQIQKHKNFPSWNSFNNSIWLKMDLLPNSILLPQEDVITMKIPNDMEGYVLFLRDTPFRIQDESMATYATESERDCGKLILQGQYLKYRDLEYMNAELAQKLDHEINVVIREENKPYWFETTREMFILADENRKDVRIVVYDFQGIAFYDSAYRSDDCVIPNKSFLLLMGTKNSNIIIKQFIDDSYSIK